MPKPALRASKFLLSRTAHLDDQRKDVLVDLLAQVFQYVVEGEDESGGISVISIADFLDLVDEHLE
ncbi:hypothetical protein ACFRAQ_34670 [Nocardia sp. NPDC056611]|uniref:hypothetical protein n=1 Tax=Nocardia sp. NPDC056611 TaxID=3345877 RepID=UPI00366F00B8